jgi:AAA+ ATPase superfamily predicted ATPase
MDAAKTYIRRYIITESLEKELYYILLLLKIFLFVFLILFSIWGSITVYHDVYYILKNWGEPPAASRSNATDGTDMQGSLVFKTIILGTLGFFIPRILWQIFPLSPFLSRLIRGKSGATTEVNETVPEYFPTPDDFLPLSVNPLQSTCNKYRRCVINVQSWFISQKDELGLNTANVQKICSNFEKKIDAAQDLFKDHSAKNHINVFVFGRQATGKSSLIRAVLLERGKEYVARIVYCGTDGQSISEVEALIGSKLVRFYESSYSSKKKSGSKDTLGSMVDGVNPSVQLMTNFILKHRTIPDAVFYVSKAKESHSVLKKDLELLQSVLHSVSVSIALYIDVAIYHLINFVDEVYPADIRRPCDYDDDKFENIKMLSRMNEDEVVQFRNDCKLSSVPSSWHPISFKSSLAVCSSYKFSKDDSTVIDERFDYRYGISSLIDIINDVEKLKLSVPVNHVYFCLLLVDLFKQISSLISVAMTETNLASKYGIELFLVSSICNEFTPTDSNLPTREADSAIIDPQDPVVFAKNFREFWMNLGFSNMAMHSFKALSEEVIKQVPAFGHILMESLSSASGINFGLEELTLKLGHAAIAYYVEQRGRSTVQKVFEGKLKYK